MDQSKYGDYDETQPAKGGGTLESRKSAEDRRTQGPRQLQKRQPSVGRAAHGRGQSGGDQRGSIGLGDGVKARKGSLRNAVRRIFGRRSREGTPQPPQTLPSMLEYPRSDVFDRIAREGSQRDRAQQDDVVQRALSAPTSMLPPPNFQRPRSPYGFPHSARLKPLDLGNPFAAQGSQLGRRKSLPSMLLSESDAAALSAAVGGSKQVPEPTAEFTRSDAAETAANEARHEKRRSRSANDLRRSAQEAKISPPIKTEEMRQWRESLQGSVLRASGFMTRNPMAVAAEDYQEDLTPMPSRDGALDDSRPSATTPAFQRDLSERDIGSPSAFGTELSHDLEDRVARLEAGLHSFRGQLAQLSADRNRRTVLIGSPPEQSSPTGDDRTASMLATDLQQDLRPSTYQYDYTRGIGQTMSSPPPRTPTLADPAAVAPNFSIHDAGAEDPFVSPSRQEASRSDNVTRANVSVPPQYTFRSLYEMLADERSARRRLEVQMRTLREEITNLHYQVSLQSNVQSQTSSYHAPMDPMVGSSRLHALLRDTEASPPSAAQSRPQHDSGQFSTGQQDLMSRFSGSESETGGLGEADDLQTPYDAYHTPPDDQGRFPFGVRSSGEGEMF